MSTFADMSINEMHKINETASALKSDLEAILREQGRAVVSDLLCKYNARYWSEVKVGDIAALREDCKRLTIAWRNIEGLK